MARDIDPSNTRVCFLVTDDEKKALDYHRMKLRISLSDMIRHRIHDYLILPQEKNNSRKKQVSPKKDK